MALRPLPSLIDHTVLRPETTKADVVRACEEARRYGFVVVFVAPCYVDHAVAALAGTRIQVGAPIGFPHGSQTTRTKVGEAVEACKRGATELDMVLNIGRLKSEDYDAVRREIAEFVQSTPGAGHKVILETCYLTQQEKMIACRLAVDAGVDYVKTSTGIGPGGATVEDVRWLKEAVAGQAKVKAAGGIRDLKTALALLDAGADRLGTSASVAIMEEWLAARKQR
ncbi:MAG: deoxyribose-phosphate aldolase [Nitrospirae bacterium]|nr:deoxyribose-phosphate aldolase [Nitrospirota bacterium]